jgi:anti-anti-sigma factor
MTHRAPSVVMATARPGGPHLMASDELDADGTARLRATLDDAVAPGVRLTLDLSRVSHLSAEALAVLVHAHRRLRDGGGALELLETSPAVTRVLRISGLHRVLGAGSAPAQPGSALVALPS